MGDAAEAVATGEGAAEAGATAGETATTAAEAAGATETGETNAGGEKLYRVKVDGEEIEVTEQELLEGYQRKRAFTKKTQELAEQRREVEATLAELEQNPGAALKKRGKAAVKAALFSLITDKDADAQAIVDEVYQDLLAESKLTDEQRELRDTKAENERLKKEREAEEKAKEDAEIADMAKRAEEGFTRVFGEALETAKVPKTPAAIARMAGLVEALVEAKGPQALTKDAISKAAGVVRREYEAEVASLLGEAEPDVLEQLLGEGTTKKLREYDLKRLKERQSGAGGAKKPPAAKKEHRPAVEDTEAILARRSRERWGRGA